MKQTNRQLKIEAGAIWLGLLLHLNVEGRVAELTVQEIAQAVGSVMNDLTEITGVELDKSQD